MAEVRKSSRWFNLFFLVFGSAVWVFNTYKLATGLGKMGLFDGLSAGMCFLLGPGLLLEYFRRSRRDAS